MAIETITREGDFVLKAAGGGDLFRIHMDEDSMSFAARQVVVSCTISEASELRDWLTRRLTEAI